MKIAGLQKLTLLDFPGHIAATIFTPGCNLRCPFCHNSEIVLNADLEYPISDVLAFLATRKGKLDGIAITGGEPLMQEGIKDFIISVREMGFKVKLDTNGSYPEKLQDLIDNKLVDYVAMDIKNAPSKWNLTAGVSGKGAEILYNKSLETMKILKESGIEYEHRTTIVRQLHSLEDMDELGSFVEGTKNYFLQNFKDSGAVLEEGYTAWDKETLLKMLEIIRKYVPEAQLRGVD